MDQQSVFYVTFFFMVRYEIFRYDDAVTLMLCLGDDTRWTAQKTLRTA